MFINNDGKKVSINNLRKRVHAEYGIVIPSEPSDELLRQYGYEKYIPKAVETMPVFRDLNRVQMAFGLKQLGLSFDYLLASETIDDDTKIYIKESQVFSRNSGRLETVLAILGKSKDEVDDLWMQMQEFE